MSDTRDNPCNACSLNQACCRRLSGLMLTRDEYERLFRNFAEGLSVKKSNGVVIVSSRVEGACPHWKYGGCMIYPERPIDCRLYPYAIRHLIEKRRKITIVFHDGAGCPHGDGLYALMTESEIRALIVAFGRKIYGEQVTIVVQREKGAFSRLRHRIEAALNRRWDKTSCR